MSIEPFTFRPPRLEDACRLISLCAFTPSFMRGIALLALRTGLLETAVEWLLVAPGWELNNVTSLTFFKEVASGDGNTTFVGDGCKKGKHHTHILRVPIKTEMSPR